MARPLAALFDVDGTLIDSNPLHVEAWHEAFAASGYPVERATLAGLIGMGADLLVAAVLPGADPAERARIADRHGHVYRNRFLHEARPFPAARDLVARTHAAGLKVVIASSADAAEVDSYVARLGIGGLVAARTTAGEVATAKPAPDIFAAALAAAGVAAERAVAVGDAPYDAEAAGKAGVRTIALLSGGYPRERLKAAGAVALFADAADLLARFDASPLAGQGGFTPAGGS